MSPLELNILGPFRINRRGQTVTRVANDKGRALLTFLALEGMQPRPTLATLLWPYLSQETAFDHLRKTLFRLRHKLGPEINDAMNGATGAAPDGASTGAGDFIIADYQSVRLDPAQVVVDALRFQSLLAECERHSHPTPAACDECLARLAEAVGFYQGDLLTGFALSDAPAFEQWLLRRRQTLHNQAVQALASLASACEVRGEIVRAQEYGSRLLTLDSCSEAAHRHQMRLLVALGQRNQALQHYQAFRQSLHDQLAVGPEAATIALYEQIRPRPKGSRETRSYRATQQYRAIRQYRTAQRNRASMG